MNIGIVCPYDIFKGGGVQECVLALRSGLEKRGHYVRVITPLPRKQTEKNIDGVDFIGTSADIKSPFHTTAQISVNLNPEAIDEYLQRHDFDVLNFHEPWVPIASRQILSRSNSCNIATFHAKLPENVMAKTIEKVITPYTKTIIKYFRGFSACSPAAAEYAESLLGKPLRIIPNGINTKRYSGDYRHELREKKILYVGRLEKRKGLEYLIEAFRILKEDDPDYQLDIAGSGVMAAKLQNLCDSYELSGVNFYGHVSEEQKLALMKNAKVFCSPAIYGESFGIVLLEAMAMGLPIVAGSNPGYRAVMKQMGDISLVNPQDPAAIAGRIKLFMEDKKLATQFSNWGKNYAKLFDYETVVASYDNYFQEVCQNTTRTTP